MTPPPNPAIVRQRIAAYNAAHPNRPLDPNAVMRVAGTEGLSGGIGDGGHAFGPFQQNDAGGVLTGKFPGLNAQQKQAWAWSPSGIDSALNGIGGVAGGQRGAGAVRSIVTGYERPANPQGEIARALGGAGGLASSGQPSAAAASPSLGGALGGSQQPPPNYRLQLAQALQQRGGSGDYSGFYQQLAGVLKAKREGALGVGSPSPTQGGTQQPLGAGVTGIAKTALTQLGTPYQWGGKAALGSRTDCSGLLQASARANGINIGRTTYEQFKQGQQVPLDQLQPGDAVFSHPGSQGPGHVAIYIGNGRVVQDPHTGASVSISTLDKHGIVGARRYG